MGASDRTGFGGDADGTCDGLAAERMGLASMLLGSFALLFGLSGAGLADAGVRGASIGAPV